MGVDDATLDVGQVGVVLKCAHEESGLFAQLGNAWSVVVGHGVVTKDSIGYLRI